MARYYSEDFRLRVLARLDAGMSKLQAHRTFGVSRSTLDDWLRLRREQGQVRDQPRTPEVRRALSAVVAFEAFATRQRGATLAQMAHAWQQETGETWSYNTFWLALQALGWTRKKRAFSIKSGVNPSATPLSSN